MVSTYTPREAPEIDFTDLTSEGRLNEPAYSAARDHISALAEDIERLRGEGYSPRENPAVPVARNFSDLLPKPDSQNIWKEIYFARGVKKIEIFWFDPS